MSINDYKCEIKNVKLDEIQEKWRFMRIQESVRLARQICKRNSTEELSEENMSFSGGTAGVSFEISLDCGFLVMINYRDAGPMYDVEVYKKGKDDLQTYSNYMGGMSYKYCKNGMIEKAPMSRKEPFSDLENEKFLNKPIKLMEAFLKKHKDIEK